MRNWCLEKSSSSDEDNVNRGNVLIDRVQNVDESNENNVKNFNENQTKGDKNGAESSNQSNTARLSLYPEIILSPIENVNQEEAKRLGLDKRNDMTIISICPTMLTYNNIHNKLETFLNSSKSVNNQFPFIPMIYNANIQQSNIPNCFNLNDLIPNKIIQTTELSMPQIVIANTQKCTEENKDNDDDVVFVKEYKIENAQNGNQDVKRKLEDASFGDKEQKETCVSANCERKKRGILVEKRKNPLRKAQMDKASIKLAENLSIPPAVFNARVSSKKTKQPANNQKVVRQSCRTTGAILRPPSPLNENDFKEWPTEGLHEIPWYNEETGTIERFTTKNIKITDTKSSTKSVPKQQCRSIEHNFGKVKIEENHLSILAHHRLHFTLDYVNELKEFNKLTKKNEVNCDSLDKVSSMLYDTCELYSLLNNTGLLPLAKYIESFHTK
ncbi:hypothetical protein FQR65_LT02762 [Abscondita terminalis]|nr:hypothetical protein FQR65_LT02762 [Abscondita terminalis]